MKQLPRISRSFLDADKRMVLLETCRFDAGNHRSYLFHSPVDVLETENPAELASIFERIDRYSRSYYLAGYVSYEAGYSFEERLACEFSVPMPLISLGVYGDAIVFDHRDGTFEGDIEGVFDDAAGDASDENFSATELALSIAEAEYLEKIETIKEAIEAGDVYQINFTMKYGFDFSGSPYAFYRALKRKQAVSYAAFIRLNGLHVLSLSPELFFRRDGDTIAVRPMKGTAGRGRTAQEDMELGARLMHDGKNRAENVMIVDLMRNDLGRVAHDVRATELFTVERYDSLHQMTSSVQATLRPDVGYRELFRALFPSGSVTGAPKIRAMQIIRELEPAARGVYTGAIGFISPKGRAVFNVPIRTITIKDGRGEMGVGSGIVHDSVGGEEYAECKLKAAFLIAPVIEFSLIETMLWDGGFTRIIAHMERLRESAGYFDFEFDEAAIRGTLDAYSAKNEPGKMYRVRLLLHKDGSTTISDTRIESLVPDNPVVTLSQRRTSRDDAFVYHKTTHRSLYDAEFGAARAMGYADVLFLNEQGELTEGAISNVYLRIGGELCTPPLSSGLLNGVFRRGMVSRGECIERSLVLDDLKRADEVWLSNAVRGMYKVRLEIRP